jgi:hypothetical protein
MTRVPVKPKGAIPWWLWMLFPLVAVVGVGAARAIAGLAGRE